MTRRRWIARAAVAGTALLMLAGCATLPDAPEGWQAVTLPGKAATVYRSEHKDGRPATAAVSRRSASLLRRDIGRPAHEVREVAFSWWVQAALPQADIADATRDDAVARVLFSFDGDHAKLSPRDRMLFELAHTLTGERPPYATLMYVYANEQPVGAIVHNPRTDRIRKIVLDAGPGQKKRWREHRRDLVADYRRAFGEEPGRLLSVALMTDSDNTQGEALAWYGPLTLE